MKFKIGFASNINNVKEIEINTLQDLQVLELQTLLQQKTIQLNYAEDSKLIPEKFYGGLLINFDEGIIVIDDDNSII